MSKVYDAFGPVPAGVPPSTPVRHWDRALLAGGLTFAVGWAGGLALGLYAVPGNWLGDYSRHLIGAPQTLLHYATLGMTYQEQAAHYLDLVRHGWQTLARVGAPLALSLAAAGWVMKRGLVAESNTWHVSGPRLLEGKEAVQEARRRSLTKEQREADPHHLALHPDLVVSKEDLSRHGFIYGSVGSGKTQVLLPIIQQLIERDERLIVYDAKGDFVRAFRKPVVLSPFLKCSYVWDVARDVRTPTQAAAFAASLIPDAPDQGNRFWSQSAQMLVSGALRYLQNTKGIDWGFKDLSDVLAKTGAELAPTLEAHYAKVKPLLANPEGQTAAGVLATVSSYTRVVDDLALAWPKVGKRSFSITEWAKDGYAGRKQVLLVAGEDQQLTTAFVSALINAVTPTILSPTAMPDNERGRCLAFILDELASLRVNIAPLIDKGRSKGVVLFGALQHQAQLSQVVGETQAKALLAMVGTHIVCRVGDAETREVVAKLLGKRRVAWRNHGQDAPVHEENRNVVSPERLTDDLGKKRGRAMGPLKWGTRSIVYTGGDPLLLNFPGVVMPAQRTEADLVPAAWTQKPAGAKQVVPTTPPTAASAPAPASSGGIPHVPQPEETRRVLGLAMEDLEQEMARIYGAD